MNRKTKIIATIGPATESLEIIEKLINAGLNIARFNTKHSDPDWHNERIQRIKQVAKKLDQPVAVLLDLQGPEIRINTPNQISFDVKEGEEVTFQVEETNSNQPYVLVPEQVVSAMSSDNLILLDDGACELVVTKVSNNKFTATAVHNCTIKHRKTLNTPGIVLDMPALTDRDFAYLQGVDLQYVDFVGLSFVRDAQDIHTLRKELEKKNSQAQIIAKIEHQSGLDNIDEIIQAADGIMVARGDLGVEVPFEELIFWQKSIINKCRIAAKPVITATQMLKSMVENPMPTRAEVSDVAHAIYDGTDAIMLSDETTIGKYPVKVVQVMDKIAKFNEKYTEVALKQTTQFDAEASIVQAAISILENSAMEVDHIVCLTEKGNTARLLSRFRPYKSILAATSNEQTYRTLNILYGVEPAIIELPESRIADTQHVVAALQKGDVVQTGEVILLISGSYWKKPGLTNNLAIIQVA